MRKSILSLALLGLFATANTAAYAEEAASDWAFSANVAYTSDYYVRGLSQNWHDPALQGGFDVEHSSGFYVGTWASNVSANTFPDASLEVDVYAGYGGEIGDSGVGYSVGVIGYLYPNGSWGQCVGCVQNDNTTVADDNSWDTYEANFGLSYSYFSAQVSTTLGNWFGVDTDTGFDDDTKEVEAGSYNDGVTYSGGDLDYTDYKLAITKEFSLAGSEGWAVEAAFVGADDDGYWSKSGFGGSSFNGRSETRDLAKDTVTLTVSRAF